MFPYWTLIKYGIPFLIGGMLFGGAAWKIQGMRLDACKVTEQSCLSANVENDKTIQALKDNIVKAGKSCQERLSSKDRTINNLRSIDDLKGKKDEKGNIASDDPVLDRLNRMFGNN